MSIPTDNRLSTLATLGSLFAFEQIVLRYRPALIRYATRFVGADAEDIVQESFVRAWFKFGEGEKVPFLKAWLYTIVKHVSLNELARRKARRELLSFEVDTHASFIDVPETAEANEALRAVFQKISKLSITESTLMEMVMQGRSVTEMAFVRGTTRAAVRQSIYKARLKLRGTP